MASTRPLSEEDFKACFASPMRDVTADADPEVDIWTYVDRLDPAALGISVINDVRHVYRDALDRFDQVLIGTGRFNTLLVVVVDRGQRVVHGHRLVDLNEKYDMHDEPASDVRLPPKPAKA